MPFRFSRVAALLIGIGSIAYYAWEVWVARTKRLWLDEIVTVYVARLPDAATVWRALAQGADGSPPGYYAIVRLARAMIADEPLAVRMPSIAAFWIFCLALGVYVGRRCGAAYAGVAMLLPLATGAAPYATDARPYGLILAGCGLALAGWQAAAGAGRRWAGLIVLVLGLALGVASHYYGVLLVVPLAAGELVRTARRQRIDLPVWLGFVVGLAPIVPSRPLMAGLQAMYRGGFFGKPEVLSVSRSYALLLERVMPIAAIALPALVWWLRRPPERDRTEAFEAMPDHELIAAATLAAFPFPVLLLALVATGAYLDRYVLPTVAGFAILIPVAVHRITRGRRGPGEFLCVLTLLGAVAAQYGDWSDDTERFLPPNQLLNPLRLAQPPSTPIVVSNADMYLQLTYYAPRALTARLLYLEDLRARPNTAEQILIRLRHFAPLRVAPFRQQLAEWPPGQVIYLYGRSNDWLADIMPMMSQTMEVRYLDLRWMVSRVTLKG
jgi:hypothetical protein